MCDWLQQQSPPLHFVQLKGGDDADFLVFHPTPFAIIAWAASDQASSRMKVKRLLAQRIALAERFGTHLPVVVVTQADTDQRIVHFADVVLRGDALPRVAHLCSTLHLDPRVQVILKDGMPQGEVQFSSETDIERFWSHSLSIEDLVNSGGFLPPESLAARLAAALSPLKEAECNVTADQVQRSSRAKSNPESSNSLSLPSVSLSGKHWFRNQRCTEAFNQTLFSFIEERCGGHITTEARRENLLGGQTIRNNVWVSDKGKRVVIRRHSIEEGFSGHELKGLIAEAWMTRVLLKPKTSAQVVLLTMGDERRFRSQESIVTRSRARHLPRLFEINELEAAGWHVAPWDFANEKPRFIEFLKEADQ